MNAHMSGQFEKNNCLLTQKSLLELYSKKKKKKEKKKANTEPDTSLRFRAIPLFPISVKSPSLQNLEEAQIDIPTHPLIISETDSVFNFSQMSPHFHFHFSS